MPAKPLTPEQKAEAAQLKRLFVQWQAERRAQKLEWSQDWCAEQLGFGQSAINQYINGKIPLNPEVAIKIGQLIGYAVAAFSPSVDVEIKRLVDLSNQQFPVPLPSPEANAENDEYMQIPRLTVLAGAGNGRPVYSEDVIEGLAFRKDFLRSVGITRPKDGSVIGVRGLSMGPLFDNAVILVNKKLREPVRNKIFVFVHEDGPVVKRVMKKDGQWIAHSDNEDKKQFPDFNFEDGRSLIGRAVWMGTKL